MNPTEWTAEALTRLEAAGYQRVDVPPAILPGAVALRRSDFRVRWFFARLHTFVVLLALEQVTAAELTDFSGRASAWARTAKGGLPRGFSSGLAVMPVVVCGLADESAREWAFRKPRKELGAMTVPMLIDPGRSFVGTYTGTLVWGTVFMGFLAEQQRMIVGAVNPPVLGQKGGGLRWLLGGILACSVLSIVLFVVLAIIF